MIQQRAHGVANTVLMSLGAGIFDVISSSVQLIKALELQELFHLFLWFFIPSIPYGYSASIVNNHGTWTTHPSGK